MLLLKLRVAVAGLYRCFSPLHMLGLARPFMNTAADGALASLYAATSPHIIILALIFYARDTFRGVKGCLESQSADSKNPQLAEQREPPNVVFDILLFCLAHPPF